MVSPKVLLCSGLSLLFLLSINLLSSDPSSLARRRRQLIVAQKPKPTGAKFVDENDPSIYTKTSKEVLFSMNACLRDPALKDRLFRDLIDTRIIMNISSIPSHRGTYTKPTNFSRPSIPPSPNSPNPPVPNPFLHHLHTHTHTQLSRNGPIR